MNDPFQAPPSEPAAPRALPLAFTASGSEYFRIWIVNLLLTVLTLGLYLPFAKARRLRYFYANTLVDQQPLAFHGDPWRMFRGHLLVSGVALTYALLSHVQPVAGSVVALVLMLLWPALWRSSLVFRLRNTSWRGLRFDFTGSLAGAYRVFAPWLLFVAAFVGAALLWARPEGGALREPGDALLALIVLAVYALGLLLMATTWVWLKRYQHGGYRIAHQQGILQLGVGAVLLLGLKAFGWSLLGLALCAGVGMLFAFVAVLLGGAQAASIAGMVAVVGVYLAFLFCWGPYFGARMQDLLWNATRAPQLRFHSRLSARRLGWLTLKNWLLMVLTLGLYWPFARVALARLRLEAVHLSLIGDLDQWFQEAQSSPNAVGEMAGDFFGFDVGL